MNFFSCCHVENEAFSRSPRQPRMKSRIVRLEIFKLVSNGNTSNKISFLHVCGDIKLVGT